MANPTERTPPSEAFVEDLTDREHVAFIQSFQDTFRAFYMTAPARVHGAQKNWVLRNVLGPFQRKFGAPSPAVVSKIDRYLRNHCRSNQQVTQSYPVPAATPRAIHWQRILERERKDDICARAAVLRSAEGVNSLYDYLRYFNCARQELIDSLSEAEIEDYKQLAGSESEVLKAPPTPAAIFKTQPSISFVISSVLREHFGWEAGQLGDIVCFFAVAYRTQDQEIHSQFSIVSNHNIPQDEIIVPRIAKEFSDYVDPSLKGLANKYIQSSKVQQPKLDVDINEISPKGLREAMMQHIITSWVNSGASRTTENLPWEELGTLEGRESYLVNHEDFASIGFPCPASTHSHGGLYQFAQKLTAPGASPLFKLLLNRQASSPVHSSPPPQGPQQHNPPISPADTTRNEPEALQTTRPALKKPCFTSTPTTLSSEVDIPQTALQQPPPAITPIPNLTPDSLEGVGSATPDIPETGDGGRALEVAVGAGGETPGATVDEGMASKQVQGKRKKAPAQRPPGSPKKLRSHLKTQGISTLEKPCTQVQGKGSRKK